jgi:hypothetical protein
MTDLNTKIDNELSKKQLETYEKTIDSTNNLRQIVRKMKSIDNNNNNNNDDDIIELIKTQSTLTNKCILVRKYIKPQSSKFEKIIKDELQIQPPLNNISGDGHKNGINYEIKSSIHSKKSKINFVQLRPHHNIDFYIFVVYNMYDNNDLGKGYIFKVPSENINQLIIEYGNYAHGATNVLGKITLRNIKLNKYEYCLRCNPNMKKSKSYNLWRELLKYEVTYCPNNF